MAHRDMFSVYKPGSLVQFSKHVFSTRLDLKSKTTCKTKCGLLFFLQS